ncbi:phage portal protein [Aerococcaceae bacterium zg-ZJ1578]|uniref:phage portal protein n=1 Tax=Aerococcaceae bacterium zg-252 TaxID=2796928 RepID=UPI001A214FB6|nr:phage portal protein [Aerococcaceae bacterium zg-1578]MBR7928446.1 phage portal protein [Aerococcaceae bacterium zg-ZUI334]MBS4462853.1 phage portal protein [Aerococcaceae bacterium zg-B36]
MLERIFSNPSLVVHDKDAEADLNNKWGSLFNIFQNKDILVKGTKATPENALLFDVVFACVNVLSDDVAKLPFKTYKRDKQGAITQVKDNDVHYVLRVKPNRYMTPFTFMKLAVTDLLIHGNFYALISYADNGDVKELIPLTSTLTYPVVDKATGDLFYQTFYRGETITLYADEVIHLKGMSVDGIRGISPIHSVRTELESLSLASMYNRDMIERGALPQGILKITGMLSKDAKDKVREHWERSNSGEAIAILDNGMDYQQIGISQSDIQWLEGQRYNTQRIASLFKVPLHKINDLTHATYTNIEAQSLDYIKHTLQPLITQIEEEFGYKLYSESKQKEDYYVKFNMDSELRGDSKSRAEVNEIYLRSGAKTINEIRNSNEDSPYTYDFASVPFMTLNVAPAENIHLLSQNNFGKALNGVTEEAENLKKGGST